MKKILAILFIFICFLSKAQTVPPTTGSGSVPSSKTYWYQGDIIQGGIIIVGLRDTLFTPRYAGTMVFWQHAGVDSVLWQYDGFKWNKVGSGGGSSALTLQQAYDNSITAGDNPIINGSDLTGTFSNNISLLAGDEGANTFSQLIYNSSQATMVTVNGSNEAFFSTLDDGSVSISSSTGVYTIPLTNQSNITGIVTQNGNSTYKSTFSQVADSIQPYLLSGDTSFNWSVDSTVNAPPVGTPSGSKVRVGTTPSGVFIGHANQIATSDGVGGFTYQTAAAGDLLYDANTDLVSKFNGSIWTVVGRASIHQGLDRFAAAIKVGSADNFPFNIWTNNVQRFQIAANGIPRFIPLSGASAGLMGLSTTGVGSNVQVGTGLQLLAGVLSSTVSGGITTADNGLNANTATNVRLGGALVTNTTVSGAFTLLLSPSRTIISAADSISAIASNNITIGSIGGTASLLGATVTAKGSTATFGSYTKSIFHYETGTGDSIAIEAKATGMRLVGVTTTSANAAMKPLQKDTVTGFMHTQLIDVSNNTAQITGTLAVVNGGTSLATLTANNLMVGAGTSAVTFIAPGTSGNILTSNGTTWVSSAAASQVWSRGQYQALASTNIVQPTTLTDTVAVGSGMATSLFGAFNVAGNASFRTNVAIGNFIPDATYRLKVGGTSSIYATGDARLETLVSINTAASPIAGQALTIAGSTAKTISAAQVTSTNSTLYVANLFTIQNAQTTAAGGNTAVQANVNNQTDQSGTQTSALYRAFFANIATQSASATPITLAIGYDAVINGNSGVSRTQTFTTVYGHRVQDIGANYPVGGMLTTGGNYYQFYADSSLAASFAGGSMWGFYQVKNTANNIKNVFQGPTSIGGTITNDNAAAGSVGEETNSTISTYTNFTTTATYQNITSISLTAGDWDLSAFFTYNSNSATITAASNAIFVISTTTASASGATEGQNISYVPQAALLGTSKFSDAIPSYRVSLSATTTYYLNAQATFTLGNPQYTGSIRARRVR